MINKKSKNNNIQAALIRHAKIIRDMNEHIINIKVPEFKELLEKVEAAEGNKLQ